MDPIERGTFLLELSQHDSFTTNEQVALHKLGVEFHTAASRRDLPDAIVELAKRNRIQAIKTVLHKTPDTGLSEAARMVDASLRKV